MSFCETVADGQCHNCLKPVEVKKNRSGLAYYKCGRCGFEAQHKKQSESGKYLQSLGAAPAPTAGPAPAPGSGEKPPAAAPAPAVNHGETPRKKSSLAGFFGGEA